MRFELTELLSSIQAIKEESDVFLGKTGKWRTSKSGQKMFIPDDNSGILGVPKAFKDAIVKPSKKQEARQESYVRPLNADW